MNERSKQDSNPRELSQFPCKSEWTNSTHGKRISSKKRLETLSSSLSSSSTHEVESIRPQLPFFWLLVNKIASLHHNLLESLKSSRQLDDNDQRGNALPPVGEYLAHMCKFLGESSLYRLLTTIRAEFNVTDFDRHLLDAYTRDFLLINCQVTSPGEIEVGAALLQHDLAAFSDNLTSLERSLSLVHYVFDKCRLKLEFYLKLCRFDPKLTSKRYTLVNSAVINFYSNKILFSNYVLDLTGRRYTWMRVYTSSTSSSRSLHFQLVLLIVSLKYCS